MKEEGKNKIWKKFKKSFRNDDDYDVLIDVDIKLIISVYSIQFDEKRFHPLHIQTHHSTTTINVLIFLGYRKKNLKNTNCKKPANLHQKNHRRWSIFISFSWCKMWIQEENIEVSIIMFSSLSNFVPTKWEKWWDGKLKKERFAFTRFQLFDAH